MKHAFLILAHDEVDLLKLLVGSLDDPRNDIYVHMDAKFGKLPSLHAEHAGLVMLEKRKDVRWGDLSMLEAEYLLFDEAVSKGPYQYYHLLSGRDLPIKSQDYIHDFFDRNAGKEFIGYTLKGMTPETARKFRRWHLFPRSFKSRNIIVKGTRAACLALQDLLSLTRNKDVEFKKGSQWVSVTDGMARLFLERKDWALKTFSHTFCCDEAAFQTICWDSPLRDNIFDTDDDGTGCMRAIGWKDNVLSDWKRDDMEHLRHSPALFARKFNMKDPDFIHQLMELQR